MYFPFLSLYFCWSNIKKRLLYKGFARISILNQYFLKKKFLFVFCLCWCQLQFYSSASRTWFISNSSWTSSISKFSSVLSEIGSKSTYGLARVKNGFKYLYFNFNFNYFILLLRKWKKGKKILSIKWDEPMNFIFFSKRHSYIFCSIMMRILNWFQD